MRASSSVRDARAQHRAYTRATRMIKRWIFSAAVRCGWDKPYEESTSTESLVKEIQLISESKIQGNYLPDKIQEILTETISFRRECLDVFESLGFIKGESVDTHIHFINVLALTDATLPKQAQNPQSSKINSGASEPSLAATPTSLTSTLDPSTREDPSAHDDENGWVVVKRRTRTKRG
ncbi:hypothetical protein F5Y02DRAFT_423405 [Annulohypoxylon stygium]|nr:hypothetical protein F5Y02DRAFT_423405 [Annulohypoxylon stygium]